MEEPTIRGIYVWNESGTVPATVEDEEDGFVVGAVGLGLDVLLGVAQDL